MRRNSLAHVGPRRRRRCCSSSGAPRRFGAEKFHSAMLPHAGTDTRIWREVVALGRRRWRRSASVRGHAGCAADVAVVWDWESWWALELEWPPVGRPRATATGCDAYYERAVAGAPHRRLRRTRRRTCRRYRAGRGAEPLPAHAAAATRTSPATSSGGGHAAWCRTSPASSTSTTPCTPGALPGRAARRARADGRGVPAAAPRASRSRSTGGLTGDVWSERVQPAGAESVRRFADGTRRRRARRHAARARARGAWYVATRLRPAGGGVGGGCGGECEWKCSRRLTSR